MMTSQNDLKKKKKCKIKNNLIDVIKIKIFWIVSFISMNSIICLLNNA